MTQIDDLNILQQEELTGGRYRNIRLFADTTVKGNLHGETINVYEQATFQGEVKTNTLKVTKDAIFHGSVTAHEVEIEGTAVFYGPVKCNRLVVKNQLTAHDKVEAYDGTIQGMATFIAYDGFQLTVGGLIQCEELLRCNHITFLESGRGELHEVFGAIVNVQSKDYLNDGKPKVYIRQLVAYDVTINHTFIDRLEAKFLKKDEKSIIGHLKIIGSEKE